MRPWKILICLLLLLAVGRTLIQAPLPVYASASDYALEHDKVIRVFFPLQKGFAELDESGGLRGYNYDFLMDIAQLTGWKYEFVTAEQTNENLQTGLDKVKSGELDLACSMARIAGQESDYLYSSKPYGTVQYTLVALESNRSLNNRTISGCQNLRIALVEKAEGQNRLLDDYCKENGIQYQPIYAQNNAECELLVENGQADMLVTKDVVFLSGYKTIVEFSSQSFYFAAGKGNSELLQELDDALASILSATPELQTQRHRQYFTKPSDYTLKLTEAEYTYLEQAPALQVAVLTERAPIQDYDNNTGEFSGAMVDILSLLSQKSGLYFELIPADSRDLAMNMITEGKADIMAGIPYSYSAVHSDSYDLLLTSPILTLPIVRASTLRTEPKHKELLVYSDTRLFMDRDDILYQDDLQEILTHIETGAYAEAYVDGYIAQHYLEQEGFKNVSLSLTPYGNYPVCLGVSRKEDLRLISILEQTIASLTPDEVEAILYQNTSHAHQTSLYDLLKRNPVPFILGAIFIFLLVSALLLTLLMKNTPFKPDHFRREDPLQNTCTDRRAHTASEQYKLSHHCRRACINRIARLRRSTSYFGY